MSLLATSDTEAAKRFYGEIFGWETDGFDGVSDETAARAAEPPFDGPVPRGAVLADPHGGVFSVTTTPGR
jgi:catechol 2,3-dioxygenase-like lactoylglutathione lyase family enzyme